MGCIQAVTCAWLDWLACLRSNYTLLQCLIVHLRTGWSLFVTILPMQCSGLSTFIGTQLEGLGTLSPAAVAFISSVVVTIVTQVVSNTATTTLFLPILAELVSIAWYWLHVHPMQKYSPTVYYANTIYIFYTYLFNLSITHTHVYMHTHAHTQTHLLLLLGTPCPNKGVGQDPGSSLGPDTHTHTRTCTSTNFQQ